MTSLGIYFRIFKSEIWFLETTCILLVSATGSEAVSETVSEGMQQVRRFLSTLCELGGVGSVKVSCLSEYKILGVNNLDDLKFMSLKVGVS